MWINPHLPEPLDLHAYLRNTSGAKWMVKIWLVAKTHSRSSSCLANPVTKPLVSSKDALVTSWQAPRRSCEAFTNSWVGQPGVRRACGKLSQRLQAPARTGGSSEHFLRTFSNHMTFLTFPSTPGEPGVSSRPWKLPGRLARVPRAQLACGSSWPANSVSFFSSTTSRST